jgi:hypothetical protein
MQALSSSNIWSLRERCLGLVCRPKERCGARPEDSFVALAVWGENGLNDTKLRPKCIEAYGTLLQVFGVIKCIQEQVVYIWRPSPAPDNGA